MNGQSGGSKNASAPEIQEYPEAPAHQLKSFQGPCGDDHFRGNQPFPSRERAGLQGAHCSRSQALVRKAGVR